MSKISNELRSCIDKAYNYCVNGSAFDEMYKLADRMYKLADRIDSEMVELPKGKDGVPIHVGDTVWDTSSGIEYEVAYINLYPHGTDVKAKSSYNCYAFVVKPKNLTHTKPDSLERIADELESAWIVGDCDFVTVSKNQLREFSDRIRKIAKDDEHEND